MRLIFSGVWLEREGIFEAPVRKLRFYSSLDELEHVEYGFLVLSYSIAEQTLGLSLKKPSFPKILLLELEKPFPLSFRPRGVKLSPVGSSFDSTSYKLGVERVKELIAQGVLYQLNLTCRFDYELAGSPLDLFLNYYRSQPVPYAFFLDLDEFYIMSGSMELFLSKQGEFIKSKPIKGTAKSRKELMNSEKDRAENLMITDMVRNDLSRIALPGSVEVEELFRIEEFRTLFQMHSTVKARTRKCLQEIIHETFPPASVVGAPKKKAVEVIDQLEPHSREYYCGAAGFVNGEDFVFSVLIRVAIGSGRELSYYAGAGIVWDSVPEREWEEVLLKSYAFSRL